MPVTSNMHAWFGVAHTFEKCAAWVRPTLLRRVRRVHHYIGRPAGRPLALKAEIENCQWIGGMGGKGNGRFVHLGSERSAVSGFRCRDHET